MKKLYQTHGAINLMSLFRFFLKIIHFLSVSHLPLGKFNVLSQAPNEIYLLLILSWNKHDLLSQINLILVTIWYVLIPTLKPVGHQSTNWMVRFVLMVAIVALTSLLKGGEDWKMDWKTEWKMQQKIEKLYQTHINLMIFSFFLKIHFLSVSLLLEKFNNV